MRILSRSLLSIAAVACTVSTAAAQRGPAPDPLVRENTTVKLAAHTYVIPDGNVGLVPNVGIVVGSRATLVIDPRPRAQERRDDPARGRQGQQERRALHRVDTFPCRAHDRLHRISAVREIRQLGRAGGGVRAGRHADGADVLETIRGDGRHPEGCRATAGGDHVRRHLYARPRGRQGAVHGGRARPTRRATRASSSRATTSSSPATSS